MRQLMTLALMGAGMAGCASTRPNLSFVTPALSAGDAHALAADVARHLTQPLRPAKTTLVLIPSESKRQDTLTPAFEEALRAAGFGVAEAPRRKNRPLPAGVQLRYLISPLDAGFIVRLQYQQREDARFYARTADGVLAAAAPFTILEHTR